MGVHYCARIEGHDLLTGRDLIPSKSAHKRAAVWYYELQVGSLQQKLPPIVSHRWRRITFEWMRSAKRDADFSGYHKWAADRYIGRFL